MQNRQIMQKKVNLGVKYAQSWMLRKKLKQWESGVRTTLHQYAERIMIMPLTWNLFKRIFILTGCSLTHSLHGHKVHKYQQILPLRMAQKITLAKIKKFGKNFEISIEPENALNYKKGIITDIREALLADDIFTDAKKGLKASHLDLQHAFKTTDPAAIADIILKQGEIQATSEQRSEEREQKRRKIISLIQRQAIDGRTGLPLPADRIEAALEQGKAMIDDHKTAEEQLADIIVKLRPILPLKIEQKRLTLTIPALYAGKSYQAVKSQSTIIKESWNNDGSWTAVVEIPAGLKIEFMEKLNSLTHGQVVVTE